MKWQKRGLIFCADNDAPNMLTYARMPTELHLHDDVYRIYFESRGVHNTAHPFSLTFDVGKMKILDIQKTPILDYGILGTFDDNGITPFTAIRSENEIRLYYAGWSRMHSVPFRNAIGLAKSLDGGQTFEKYSAGPVLAQDIFDPIFPTGPQVIKDNGIWKVWYTSFEKWQVIGDQVRHYYNIKYRESKDGIYWLSSPTVAIDFQNEDEYAFVCRSVIKHENKYKMWYSFRAQPGIDTYRIGYAESHDGLMWERKDHLSGIDVSSEGWDSEMICYPRVFEHKGDLYMLYNGNGYGKTGFGIAVMER